MSDAGATMGDHLTNLDPADLVSAEAVNDRLLLEAERRQLPASDGDDDPVAPGTPRA